MKMLDFCILCMDDSKILNIFNNRNFHDFSPRNVTGATSPPPQRPYDVSGGQNRYVTLP